MFGKLDLTFEGAVKVTCKTDVWKGKRCLQIGKPGARDEVHFWLSPEEMSDLATQIGFYAQDIQVETELHIAAG